jgi:hypothetical protein
MPVPARCGFADPIRLSLRTNSSDLSICLQRFLTIDSLFRWTTMDRFYRACAWLCWCVPLILAGCAGSADELPREAVSGKVAIGGQPLKDGRIDFRPGQGVATAGVAKIVDGNYTIDRSTGLVPAKYQVMISTSASESSKAPASGGMPGDAAPPKATKEPIPGKYNAKSTLSAEVTKAGPNQFDFDLDAK